MKKELLNCEEEMFGTEIPLLDEIYIIPTRKKHDSGYMCMEIIGANREGYKKKLATYSDVIDIDDVIISRKYYCNLSMDIPEYGVLRFFSRLKIKVTSYGISTFAFDLVDTRMLKGEDK